MALLQRPNTTGVAANSFNPANPNQQAIGEQQVQAGYSGQYDDFDFEPAPETAYPAGRATPADGSLPSNTSNAAIAEAETAATTPGANQVVRAAGVDGSRTSQVTGYEVTGYEVTGYEGTASDLQDAAPVNQPSTRWRFYEWPATGQPAAFQLPGATTAESRSATPGASQQPSGVSEAATGSPIKF